MIFEELKSGKSVEGSEIIAYKTDIKSKQYIYLVAGIFGQKIEGIYVLNQLLDWLSSNHEIKDIPLIIVPILNVDGYQSQTAENSCGIKLIEEFNEDDIKRKPELKYFFKLLNKYPANAVIHFSTKKPPKIQFSEGGKHIASFISKFNFYDLFKLETESLDKKKSLSLPFLLHQKYQCPLVEIQYPKISPELSLAEIWSHNAKALKDLFATDFLYNHLNTKKQS